MTQLEKSNKKIADFEAEKLKDVMHLDADEIGEYVDAVRNEYVLRIYRVLKQAAPETMNPDKIRKFLTMVVKSLVEIYPGKSREIVEGAYALTTLRLTDVETFKHAYTSWLDSQFDRNFLGGKRR